MRLIAIQLTLQLSEPVNLYPAAPLNRDQLKKMNFWGTWCFSLIPIYKEQIQHKLRKATTDAERHTPPLCLNLLWTQIHSKFFFVSQNGFRVQWFQMSLDNGFTNNRKYLTC